MNIDVRTDIPRILSPTKPKEIIPERTQEIIPERTQEIKPERTQKIYNRPTIPSGSRDNRFIRKRVLKHPNPTILRNGNVEIHVNFDNDYDSTLKIFIRFVESYTIIPKPKKEIFNLKTTDEVATISKKNIVNLFKYYFDNLTIIDVDYKRYYTIIILKYPYNNIDVFIGIVIIKKSKNIYFTCGIEKEKLLTELKTELKTELDTDIKARSATSKLSVNTLIRPRTLQPPLLQAKIESRLTGQKQLADIIRKKVLKKEINYDPILQNFKQYVDTIKNDKLLNEEKIISLLNKIVERDTKFISKNKIVKLFKKIFVNLTIIKNYDYNKSNLYSLIILQYDNVYIGIVIIKKFKQIYFCFNFSIIRLLINIYGIKDLWKIQSLIKEYSIESLNESSTLQSFSQKDIVQRRTLLQIIRLRAINEQKPNKSQIISFIQRLTDLYHTRQLSIFNDSDLDKFIYFFEKIENCILNSTKFQKPNYDEILFDLTIKNISQQKDITHLNNKIFHSVSECFRQIFDFNNKKNSNEVILHLEKQFDESIYIIPYENIYIGFLVIYSYKTIYLGCNYTKERLEYIMSKIWVNTIKSVVPVNFTTRFKHLFKHTTPPTDKI